MSSSMLMPSMSNLPSATLKQKGDARWSPCRVTLGRQLGYERDTGRCDGDVLAEAAVPAVESDLRVI